MQASGCPRGWLSFRGHCYGYFGQELTWRKAEVGAGLGAGLAGGSLAAPPAPTYLPCPCQAWCKATRGGGHLASLHTPEEHRALAAFIAQCQRREEEEEDVWIGLYHRVKAPTLAAPVPPPATPVPPLTATRPGRRARRGRGWTGPRGATRRGSGTMAPRGGSAPPWRTPRVRGHPGHGGGHDTPGCWWALAAPQRSPELLRSAGFMFWEDDACSERKPFVCKFAV